MGEDISLNVDMRAFEISFYWTTFPEGYPTQRLSPEWRYIFPHKTDFKRPGEKDIADCDDRSSWNSCRCRPGKRPERFWRKNIRIFGARSEIIWRMAYRCIFPMQQEKPRAWGVKYDRYGRKIRINGGRKELRRSVRLPACSRSGQQKVTDGPRRDRAKPDGSGKKQHRKGCCFLSRSLASAVLSPPVRSPCARNRITRREDEPVGENGISIIVES